jgi:hypothetical protein
MGKTRAQWPPRTSESIDSVVRPEVRSVDLDGDCLDAARRLAICHDVLS